MRNLLKMFTSADCGMLHVEAEYAFNKGKTVIALRLEAGYVPDGWLGPLVLNNLHYNFSRPERFDSEFSKLLAVLQNLRQSDSNKGFCYDYHVIL